jgi:thymidylate synthase
MNNDEQQYLNILKQIMETGEICEDRTKTGTKSIFGCQMKYRLDIHFPLLTTKKMFVKGIIEELLWFVKGETNSKLLEEKGVHIWKDNSSRAFLNGLGLYERAEGDCGPIYGFNFRHYGEHYTDCYNNQAYGGIDQIGHIIHLIRTDPNSRRMLIQLWDPVKIDEMVLPPCHVLYQFRVYKNKLSCCLYQRSGDMGLGVPFTPFYLSNADLYIINSAKGRIYAYKRRLSVKSNSYLITFNNADPLGSAFEMLKGVILPRPPY